MPDTPPLDAVWWITAIEIPVLSGLFWLLWRVKHEAEEATEGVRRFVDQTNLQLKDALASFKLEVAQSYASMATLKDVEARLTDHLLRIEAKLDDRMRLEALQ